jgi:hypothetical protein
LPRTAVDLLAFVCNLLVVESLTTADSGWTRYDATGLPPVYLRWTPNDRGRWVLRELFIDASESEPITAAKLGRVPVSALEAFVNGDRGTRDRLDSHAGYTSPVGGPVTGSNVAVLMSHYTTHFGAAADPATNWVALAQLSTHAQLIDQETGKKVDNPYQIKKRRQSARREMELDADYRLTQPPGPDGLSDEFLSRVGRAYVAAALRGEPPNRTIHEDVGFNPTAKPRTVERWVYEARKRGIMPPARAKGARG